MSLTSREEIEHVGRVRQGCYKDRCEDVVRVRLVEFEDTTHGQHYTATDCQLTNQVSARQAEWGSRPTSS